MKRRSYSDSRAARIITVRYAGQCLRCGAAVPVGTRAIYFASARALACFVVFWRD